VVNDKRACLHICVTCRRDNRQSEPEAAEPVPGRLLHDAVAGLLDRGPNSSGLEVQPVICLANCDRGCSAILSAPGKWAYMVGGLGPEHAADVIAYGEARASLVRDVSAACPVEEENAFDAAVARAAEVARPGDAVLLFQPIVGG